MAGPVPLVPMAVAGQDYLRRKQKKLGDLGPTGPGEIVRKGTEAFTAAMTPEERRRGGVVGAVKRGVVGAAGEAGRQMAGGARVAGEIAGDVGEAASVQAGKAGIYLFGEPAPTGAAKAPAKAAEQAQATTAARSRAPEAQAGEYTPTTPTSTGGGGPSPEAGGRVVRLPGETGFAVVHERGADPATRPGGFAHPSARPRDPLEDLPERGVTTYGPESVTGGHQWTRRTPGGQEARYERARYQRGVQARQAAEDAAISELDARAAAAAQQIARSRALEEQPFAPEMAEVAGAVGKERARAAPETRRMNLAMEAFMQYQSRAAQIDADPDLSPEEKMQAKRDAEREAWMSIIAVQPGARKPREEFTFGAGLTPGAEEV